MWVPWVGSQIILGVRNRQDQRGQQDRWGQLKLKTPLEPCLLRRAPGRSSAGAAPGPPLALHQPLLLPPTLLWLLLALLLTLLLALLLRLRQQWRGWPLGEPACTCRRCCVKPLAERRWQSTHGRQALKKTAVPEPARELPLAKQARALRRPLAAGCPGRCAIAPAGWMANLWRGARGRGGTARHSTWSTSRGGSGKEILNARSSGTLP